MGEKSDYYSIAPRAVELLLKHEQFAPIVWNCACGEEHVSKILAVNGYEVITGARPSDSLWGISMDTFSGDIVANPPYKHALEYCQKALETVQIGSKVAMFLKLAFLEGKERRKFFKAAPPKTVYVFPSRVLFAKAGDYSFTAAYTAIPLAWFIWVKGFCGDPVIKWIE